MKDADGQVLGGMKLLGKGWGMYASHLKTYLLLMILVVLFQVLVAAIAVFGIAREQPGVNLRETINEMSSVQTFGVVVAFLLSLAIFYRALAGSMLATSEFSEGRVIGAIEAFRRVRWKHTRLFWLPMASFITGRFALIVGLLAGFFFASAFPAAVAENLGAFQALKRGEKLATGNQVRILTIYTSYLLLVAGVGAGIFKVWGFAQDLFGKAWYAKATPAIFFLIFFTVIQWYMIVLTLNYLQQRKKLSGSPAPIAASPDAPLV